MASISRLEHGLPYFRFLGWEGRALLHTEASSLVSIYTLGAVLPLSMLNSFGAGIE